MDLVTRMSRLSFPRRIYNRCVGRLWTQRMTFDSSTAQPLKGDSSGWSSLMTDLMKCKKSQSTVRMDVVFTYGRFNPPHLGHKMMIEEIINKARKMKKIPVVIVSHTTGNPRNPLSVNNKLRILRHWFPEVTFLSSSKN